MKMAPAEMPDVIMTLVSYFYGLPGVPRKARSHWHYRAGFALKVTICRNNVTPLFADAATQEDKEHVGMCIYSCKCAGNMPLVPLFAITI